MLSAIRFNLDQSKILSSGNGLNETEIVASVSEQEKNTVERKENLVTSIFFFTHIFSSKWSLSKGHLILHYVVHVKG